LISFIILDRVKKVLEGDKFEIEVGGSKEIFLLKRIKLNKSITSDFNETCKMWKLASEKSDNILKLFDYFVEDDVGNLVLENYSLLTLSDLISRKKQDKKTFLESVLLFLLLISSFFFFFFHSTMI
jgi:serine/threonine protein kinase